MMRFTYSISHVPGWEQVSADALSHAPSLECQCWRYNLNNVVEDYAMCSVKALSATEKRLLEIINKECLLI